MHYENRPTTPWEPCGVCLTTNCALRVTSHSNCSRHEYRYDHWNWELNNGETIRDHGFLQRYPPLLTTELDNIPTSKVVHSFKKKELDPNRGASEEASVDIFFQFINGGEDVLPEKIYHEGLLREVLEQNEEDDEEPVEAEHKDSQKSVLKIKDRIESWLDTSD